VSRRLPEADIGFLMIGSHEVNHSGCIRTNMDVDFMLASEDVSAVRQVLKDAGVTNVSEGETFISFRFPILRLSLIFCRWTLHTGAAFIRCCQGNVRRRIAQGPLSAGFASDETLCSERQTSPLQRA